MGIYSFLGDAYNTPLFFREAFQLLKRGGELVLILPNYSWASALRRELKIPAQMTIFVSGNSQLFAPSFTIPKRVLTSQLIEHGFEITRTTDLFLPPDFPKDRIPEHIMIPSRVQKLDPYTLPVLSVFEATK
jgi:hypothetical protein